MFKIYVYKLSADNGGAPCVQRGLLSLSICKPRIRICAKRGDLIFGFAANSLHRDNRLIYVAAVTSNLRNGNYYKGRRFTQRPDCIYRFEKGRFKWRTGAKYHGSADLTHDLGNHPEYSRANVILSKDFRYFGRDGDDEYKSKYPIVKAAVERLGQGERVRHTNELRNQLIDMKDWIWSITSKRDVGRHTSKPSRRVCHRSKSCLVISETEC